MQGAHQCGLVDVPQLIFLVPLDLIGFPYLRVNLLLELPLPLRHAHAQGLPKAQYPFLNLGSRLLLLPELNQCLPVDHVGLDVGVIQLDSPQGVIILVLKALLNFEAFRAIQVVGRVAIINLLEGQGRAGHLQWLGCSSRSLHRNLFAGTSHSPFPYIAGLAPLVAKARVTDVG